MTKTLPYFPNVVEYILRELLKNSMRAIVEKNKGLLGTMHNVKKYFEENQESLCKVLITSDPDDEHFTFAIQDQGGGIDKTNMMSSENPFIDPARPYEQYNTPRSVTSITSPPKSGGGLNKTSLNLSDENPFHSIYPNNF